MKALVSCFIFGACQLCFAAGDTSIIAVGEWSKPVSLRNGQLHDQAIRGRLLILQGMAPAYGGSPTTNGAMTFIELQNVTGAIGEGIEVYFAVTNLHCDLSDAAGKAVPEPTAGPWSGRGPLSSCWVNLPYNSTIRLFVNAGTVDPLTVYPSGEPWCHWSIAGTDTNAYFLTGILNLSTHTNLSVPPEAREMYYKLHCTATLELPKVRITAHSTGNRQIAEQPNAPDDAHVKWTAASLKEMETIKVGMSRKDLLAVFATEGGLSTRLKRTFVFRKCPFIKVDVTFAAQTETETNESADIIASISKPYLQFAVLD